MSNFTSRNITDGSTIFSWHFSDSTFRPKESRSCQKLTLGAPTNSEFQFAYDEYFNSIERTSNDSGRRSRYAVYRGFRLELRAVNIGRAKNFHIRVWLDFSHGSTEPKVNLDWNFAACSKWFESLYTNELGKTNFKGRVTALHLQIGLRPAESLRLFVETTKTRDLIVRSLANTYNTPQFSDLDIQLSDGKVLKASHEFNGRSRLNSQVHKLILSMHSDVLSALCAHNFKENTTGVLNLEHLDSKLVDLMFRFMYTGQVEDLKTVAADLFVFADCYQVKGLTELCLHSIREQLSLNTAIQSLNLVAAYDVGSELKNAVLDFCAVNIGKIKSMVGYSELKEENPQILIEILERRQ